MAQRISISNWKRKRSPSTSTPTVPADEDFPNITVIASISNALQSPRPLPAASAAISSRTASKQYRNHDSEPSRRTTILYEMQQHAQSPEISWFCTPELPGNFPQVPDEDERNPTLCPGHEEYTSSSSSSFVFSQHRDSVEDCYSGTGPRTELENYVGPSVLVQRLLDQWIEHGGTDD